MPPPAPGPSMAADVIITPGPGPSTPGPECRNISAGGRLFLPVNLPSGGIRLVLLLNSPKVGWMQPVAASIDPPNKRDARRNFIASPLKPTSAISRRAVAQPGQTVHEADVVQGLRSPYNASPLEL